VEGPAEVLAVGAEAKAGEDEEEQAEDMTHRWDRTDERWRDDGGKRELDIEPHVGLR
jgi:hypothetical protein